MEFLDKDKFLNRQKNESPKEFQIRLCKNRKEYDLTWDEVAHILNEEYDEKKSESVYRKWWYAFSDGCEYTNSMYKDIPKGTTKEDIEAVKEINEDENATKQVEIEIQGNGTQTSTVRVKLTEEQKKDADYLLRVHGYDPNQWEIVNAKQTIWNQNSNKKGMIDLYSSKITVKPRKGFNWNEENIRKIFDSLGTDKVFEPEIYEEKENDRNLLFIPLADIHFGLYATMELSGEDYNTRIAKRRVRYVIDKVLERISDKHIDKIIFLVGNDGINADNIAGTTTSGTPQDNQLNWFDTIRQFTELMIEVLDKLEQIAPVLAFLVPSNHDLHSMFGICETLKAYYRNNPNITICGEATQRKYFRFGKNMIGFSHDEKEKNVAKIMAAEQPKIWGETKFKYFMISHLHHEIVKDDYGVDIRRLPTISGRSYWTNKCGFVGTKKQGQAFIFNENEGLVDLINVNILD